MESRTIGIVLDNLRSNQTNYACITQINRTHDLDKPSVFVCDASYATCINASFPIYDIADTSAHTIVLIATSIDSMINVLKYAPNVKILYYINDLEYLRKDRNFNNDKFTEVMHDNSIVKFTVCQDYIDELTKLGCINLSQKIVKYFRINEIMEIVNKNE